MIIIYNLSGLLIGVLGVFLGIAAFLTTGQFWLGVLVIGSVWLWASLWWRKGTPQSGKRPFPSIFFIPLPFWALLAVPLAAGAGFVQVAAASRPTDARAQHIDAAQSRLRTAKLTGDEALARRVYDSVSRAMYVGSVPDRVSVYAERRDDAVLVIVKISNLRKFSDAAKAQSLDNVLAALESESGKQIYAGIMGIAAFGAVHTPEGRLVDDIVPERMLHGFVGPPPAVDATQVPRQSP